MKYTLINLILCVAIVSCTSKQKENSADDSVKKTVAAPVKSGPFDLAGLTLKEKDLPSLVAAQQVKSEPVSDAEQTLLGCEVFKSSSPKLLRFGGKDLSGANGADKNHVLLHYDDKSKSLAFYEVELYTQEQADALLSQLQKMGAPVFEKVGLGKGEVAIDLNGNPIERGKEKKQAYRVWENKSNGLSYFFGELGSGKDFNAELTVLNRASKYAKDWISLGSLDWYKHN